MLNVARGGGCNTIDKFACEGNYEPSETFDSLDKLCKENATKYRIKNPNQNNLIGIEQACPESIQHISEEDLTKINNNTTLFAGNFAPCSLITINLIKVVDDNKYNIATEQDKTCYGGPKDNFYVEGNEIKQCPVIASTTNHNYDNSAYTDNKGNGNRTNPNWSKFDASSCKFYGGAKNEKEEYKNQNKTGFCNKNGKNCLYFDNDYEIGDITICNADEECYSNNTEGKKVYTLPNETQPITIICEKNQKISKGEKSCK